MTATKTLKRRRPPRRHAKGPRPYTQRSAKTIFVRVPGADWPTVKRGFQRVLVGGQGRQTAMHTVKTPTPVVAWSIIRKAYDCRLMILEDVRQEHLGAIDPQEAGFESMAEFRRYWMAREGFGKKFPALRLAWVYTLRPVDEDDREQMGLLLYDRLYGEFTNGNPT